MHAKYIGKVIKANWTVFLASESCRVNSNGESVFVVARTSHTERVYPEMVMFYVTFCFSFALSFYDWMKVLNEGGEFSFDSFLYGFLSFLFSSFLGFFFSNFVCQFFFFYLLFFFLFILLFKTFLLMFFIHCFNFLLIFFFVVFFLSTLSHNSLYFQLHFTHISPFLHIFLSPFSLFSILFKDFFFLSFFFISP